MGSKTRGYQASLKRRIERHKAFHARREPGDLLVYVNGARHPSLEGFLCSWLHERGADACLSPGAVEPAVRQYVDQLRAAREPFYVIDDDCVPSALVYWGIGGITAAMTGLEPVHDGVTSWLEPRMGWDDIGRLAFDPANRWVRFAVDVNRALWRCWDGDFAVLPFLHRSPLDAANGIRGTDLFAEMIAEPERVIRLVDWCADWAIGIETLIKAKAPRPAGAGVGVWGSWLPDDAVFVNGDPVGLVSREHAEMFDRPSIEKLFTRTGGGYFHNHTVGLYQADLVSSYRGSLVQAFVDDPRQPSLTSALLAPGRMRDVLVAASLECPLAGAVPFEKLDEVLEVAVAGRFMLWVFCPTPADAESAVRKVRAVSRLDA